MIVRLTRLKSTDFFTKFPTIQVIHTHDDNHAHFKCTVCNLTVCLEDIEIPVVRIPKKYKPEKYSFLIEGYLRRMPKEISELNSIILVAFHNAKSLNNWLISYILRTTPTELILNSLIATWLQLRNLILSLSSIQLKY